MAVIGAGDSTLRTRARGLTPGARRRLATGLMFISPWLLGFALFTLYPMVASLVYSFSNVRFGRPLEFVGAANYANLLRDPNFTLSLGNTFWIVLIAVPVQLGASFVCAMLLNLKVAGQSFYRVIYYLPAIVPSVASTLLWSWLLRADDGLLNTLLGFVGIQGPLWTVSPDWAKPSLVLLGLWGVGNTMMIYLAGLQDVPISLHEAAELDGAGWWTRLWRITVPMVSSITLFNLVIGVIDAFQYFSQAYVLARLAPGGTALGAPEGSTLFYAVLLYSKLIEQFKIGEASAMAWILFAIVLICTLLILRFSGRFTYYADEDK
jgi:multiple sugar transport system permease protein